MKDTNWIEINVPWDEFCERGLNRTGTLIATEFKTYLIGDINEDGGVCDCCQYKNCNPIKYDTIVTAYKIIYTPEQE